jgi:signal peptidase I
VTGNVGIKKMNDKLPHRKWVGLALGFLLHGSAHFLSGNRIAGLTWYFGLLACGVLSVLLMALPGTVAYVIAIIFLVVGLVLWVAMLKQSYRSVPRIGFLRWLLVIGLSASLGTGERFLLNQVVRPFKVPTGAMQPTIFGIHGQDVPADSTDRPGMLQWLFAGRRFQEVKATTAGALSISSPSLGQPAHGTYVVGSRSYQLPQFARPRKQLGAHVSAGETLWSGIITAGDHVFAERLSYRFGKPKRGDIIVFRTDGIRTLPLDTVYIKRIAGLPGERVRIDPPFLIIDDQKVTEPAIFRVISGELDGYASFQLAVGAGSGGVLTKPNDEVTLGPDDYFVLGDNTHNSYDSRYWGVVPGKNIIGKVTRIYWPFTRINALEQE